jgi:hypothetical protein
MHDYYVVIARDACGDYESARHINALSKLDLSFGTVVTVSDIAQRWTAEATRARAAPGRAETGARAAPGRAETGARAAPGRAETSAA